LRRGDKYSRNTLLNRRGPLHYNEVKKKGWRGHGASPARTSAEKRKPRKRYVLRKKGTFER